MIEKSITEEMEKEAAEARPLFDEDALQDEDAAGEKIDEAVEDPPEVKGDIFKDFPAEAETEDSAGEDSDATDAGDDADEKKVDPFANTELED